MIRVCVVNNDRFCVLRLLQLSFIVVCQFLYLFDDGGRAERDPGMMRC